MGYYFLLSAAAEFQYRLVLATEAILEESSKILEEEQEYLKYFSVIFSCTNSYVAITPFLEKYENTLSITTHNTLKVSLATCSFII